MGLKFGGTMGNVRGTPGKKKPTCTGKIRKGGKIRKPEGVRTKKQEGNKNNETDLYREHQQIWGTQKNNLKILWHPIYDRL